MEKNFKQALAELQIAKNHFNNVAPEFFEVANHELNTALAKVQAYLIYQKQNGEMQNE